MDAEVGHASSNEPVALLGKPPRLEPIRAQKLYLAAANQIATAITLGKWNAGDKLPAERELCEMLGVSRSTTRQALAALEVLTIIMVRAGVGAFVGDGALKVISEGTLSEMMTVGDPRSLVAARAALEPGVAELAARNHDARGLGKVKRWLEVMDGIRTASITPTEYLAADIEFHLSIAMATQNSLVIQLVEEVIQRMRTRVWLLGSTQVVSRRAHQYQDEHQAIFDGIRARNSDAARERMAWHLASIAANQEAFTSILENG